MDTDRNLLFAVLALQDDLLDRERFVQVCTLWAVRKDTPIAELVRLAKIRWRVEHDYRELKTGLGLDHFEGRSFTGWHRHVTLAALAQAFCTMIRNDPKVPAPG